MSHTLYSTVLNAHSVRYCLILTNLIMSVSNEMIKEQNIGLALSNEHGWVFVSCELMMMWSVLTNVKKAATMTLVDLPKQQHRHLLHIFVLFFVALLC